MSSDSDKPPKVVDLSEVRKRQKTINLGKNFRPNGRADTGKKGKGNGKLPKGARRGFWDYVQFVLFMLFAAYFMRLCSGESFF